MRLAGEATRSVAAWRAGRPRTRAAIPTVVVGGLTVGGAGKTPIVALLARHLEARGLRVAVVTRGYGGRVRSATLVERPDARVSGDEASALRRSLPPGVQVWASPRLRDALAAASADVVLVDDGFQDPTLPRSADLVVVDATAPAAVLPAGPLREPLEALGRADLVWLHKVDEPGARAPVGHPADVESVVAARTLVAPGGEHLSPAWLADRAVVMVAGIGRPSSFRHTLVRLGARVSMALEVADHAEFSARALRRLERSGLPVVTTAKDRERLPAAFAAHVLEVEVDVRRGWPTVEALLERVLSC
jgi:tetraacyldisaccharide 4'-kinase